MHCTHLSRASGPQRQRAQPPKRGLHLVGTGTPHRACCARLVPVSPNARLESYTVSVGGSAPSAGYGCEMSVDGLQKEVAQSYGTRICFATSYTITSFTTYPPVAKYCESLYSYEFKLTSARQGWFVRGSA